MTEDSKRQPPPPPSRKEPPSPPRPAHVTAPMGTHAPIPPLSSAHVGARAPVTMPPPPVVAPRQGTLPPLPHPPAATTQAKLRMPEELPEFELKEIKKPIKPAIVGTASGVLGLVLGIFGTLGAQAFMDLREQALKGRANSQSVSGAAADDGAPAGAAEKAEQKSASAENKSASAATEKKAAAAVEQKPEALCDVRPLSPKEKAVVSGIFGAARDNLRVQQCDESTGEAAPAGIVYITVTGKENAATDYGAAPVGPYGAFVEAASKAILPRGKDCTPAQTAAAYSLEGVTTFSSLCADAQAETVKKYSQRFLHATRKQEDESGYFATNTLSRDTVLRRIVDDALPQAEKTRVKVLKNPGQRHGQ